jgi:hypothetical protein
MELKLDDDGHVVVRDGKPVYEHDDGKEVAFDAQTTVATISRLNAEAKSHREAKEAAEAKLKAFEGIDNAEEARKAMDVVRNLEQGQLVTAGKVQEIKDAAAKASKDQVEASSKALRDRIQELESKYAEAVSTLYNEKVGTAFNRSKFIADKVAVPIDMVQAMFGQRFKVEEGKIVGHDPAGNKIYSRAKPGELAEFDEALEAMIDSYGHRDSILKGTGHAGTGAHAGANGNGGTPAISTKRRSDFKTERERAAFVETNGLAAYQALPA